MISKKLNSSDVDWGENNSTITNKSVKNLVNQTKQRKKTTIPSSLKKKKKKDSAGKETRTQRTKCNVLLQPQPRSLFTSTSPRDRRALILILIDWSCPNRTENTAPPTNLPSEWRMTRSWDEEVNVHTIGRFSASNSIPQTRSMTDGSYQTDCGVSGLSLRVEVKSK